MLSLLLTQQPGNSTPPRGNRWLPAQVPGCVHLDLQLNRLIPDRFYGFNECDFQWMERKD